MPYVRPEPAFILASQDAGGWHAQSTPLAFRKELIHVGHHVRGDQTFDVTEDDLVHWDQTFREMQAADIVVPVPLEHNEDDPELNRGHLIGTEVGVNQRGIPSIFGIIQFIDEAAARLTKSARVSIYVPPEVTDGTGKIWKRPIRHVALTDYPVVVKMDGWEPIFASFSTPSKKPKGTTAMKLATAIKKALSSLKFAYDEDDDEDKLASALEEAIEGAMDEKEKEIAALKKSLKAAEEKEDVEASEDDEDKEAASLKASLARVTTAQIDMIRENRETKLDRLVDSGAITPAVRSGLVEQFCGTDTLRLSLANAKYDDGFSRIVKTLSQNEPVEMGERTRGQTTGETRAVALSQLRDPAKNPLLANAEARAKTSQRR